MTQNDNNDNRVTGEYVRLTKLMELSAGGRKDPQVTKTLRSIPGHEGKFRIVKVGAVSSRSDFYHRGKTVVAFFKLIDGSSDNSDEWIYEEISSETNEELFLAMRDAYRENINRSEGDIARAQSMRRTGTGGGYRHGAGSAQEDKMLEGITRRRDEEQGRKELDIISSRDIPADQISNKGSRSSERPAGTTVIRRRKAM